MTEALKAGQSGGDGQMCVWALFPCGTGAALGSSWGLAIPCRSPGDSSSGHKHIVNGTGRDWTQQPNLQGKALWSEWSVRFVGEREEKDDFPGMEGMLVQEMGEFCAQ